VGVLVEDAQNKVSTQGIGRQFYSVLAGSSGEFMDIHAFAILPGLIFK
jgi:hypothetical protein